MMVQAGKPLVQKYEATKINKLSNETILFLTFLSYFSPLRLNFARRKFAFSPLDYI